MTQPSARFSSTDLGMRQNLPREHGFEPVARQSGEIPEWADATLYRNGPGYFERFGAHYGHAFQGDGAITAVRLTGGRATMATRFVRTPEFLQEEEAGRLLYGPEVPWIKRLGNMMTSKSKNPANVNVIPWRDGLLAMPEGGLPYSMTLDDLETRHQERTPGLTDGFHSAHPHWIEKLKSYVSFRILWGRRTHLSLFTYPTQGRPREIARIELDHPSYVHDFVVTDKHLIFFMPPVNINLLRAILQVGSLGQMFSWRPEQGTHVIVVPLEDLKHPIRFDAMPFFQWHFANAFSQTNNTLCVDFVHWPDFSSFDAVGSVQGKATSTSSLQRAHIDLSAKTLLLEPLATHECEFPSVFSKHSGTKSTIIWAEVGGPEGSGVMACDPSKGEVQTYWFEPGEQASEPNYLARQNSNHPQEGLLSTLVYSRHSHTSYLALFDARRIADGPVAKLWFDHHIPMTFHGCWIDHKSQLTR